MAERRDGPPTAPTAERRPSVRRRLALALDVDDLVAALRLARELRPWFGVAKVGLELFSAAGPDAIGALVDLGYEVFVDLKLHDIPTTVSRAARVLGALGARYLTLHARGRRRRCCGPGSTASREGAAGAGPARARSPLAVTVLTSDDRGAAAHPAQAGAGRRSRRAAAASCAPPPTSHEVAPVRAPRLPWSSPASARRARRRTTRPGSPRPREALDAGADLLVVGRASPRPTTRSRPRARWSASLA